MLHPGYTYGSRGRQMYDANCVYAICRKTKSKQPRRSQTRRPSRPKRRHSPRMYGRAYSRNRGNMRRTSPSLSSSMRRNTQEQQRRSRGSSSKQRRSKSRQTNSTRKREATFRCADIATTAACNLLTHLKTSETPATTKDHIIDFLFEHLCTEHDLQLAQHIFNLMTYNEFEALYESNKKLFDCTIEMDYAADTFPILCDNSSENGWNADFLRHTTDDSRILELLKDDNKKTLLSKIKSEIRQDEVLLRISAIALYFRGHQHANKSSTLMLKLSYVTPKCSMLEIIQTTDRDYKPTAKFATILNNISGPQDRFLGIAHILDKTSEKYTNVKIIISCTTYDKEEYTHFEFTPLQKYILDHFCTETKKYNVYVNVKFGFDMSHEDSINNKDYNQIITKWPLVKRERDTFIKFHDTISVSINYDFGNREM